tara:strand:- start:2034 stop:2846 length:813 start_codon:yes stop_codon:yes gene_type:complete
MTLKNIVILTGDEMRHQYFKAVISNNKNINVLKTFCEGNENSLENRIYSNPQSSEIEKYHVNLRINYEKEFFQDELKKLVDKTNSVYIKKNHINSTHVVEKIIKLNPDLIVCYGSSIIKSDLIERFKNKFLNVHLGLSPYYRGSGTNVWPIINNELFMIGATFMYIDSGIDTGQIIHQFRAEILEGDNCHTIGNRVIKKMSNVYSKIIIEFCNLSNEKQPQSDGLLYKMNDFDELACRKLYQQFENGVVKNYLENKNKMKMPYIVKNKAL